MSQVEFIYNKHRLREFCLIETQGSLETDAPAGLRAQQRFGEIQRNADGSVKMVIGIHHANGSVVKLKNPLAVVRKRPAEENDGSADIQYDIVAVLKEKFLFKSRPDVVLQKEILNLPTV
ncbi:hypothetical protein EC988_001330 [Linderina pennispora]|nr:hypothetical protein EC988_001330 [Linderina pennispora]